MENSWGKEKGHEGYWSLYDNWFNEHLYMIVVKKAYVPKEVLKSYQQNAHRLAALAPHGAAQRLNCRRLDVACGPSETSPTKFGTESGDSPTMLRTVPSAHPVYAWRFPRVWHSMGRVGD